MSPREAVCRRTAMWALVALSLTLPVLPARAGLGPEGPCVVGAEVEESRAGTDRALPGVAATE